MALQKHQLRESALASLLCEIPTARINIESQDRMNLINPNYPSSFEVARTLLYRASEGLGIKIPKEPFKNSSEVYNYLSAEITSLKLKPLSGSCPDPSRLDICNMCYKAAKACPACSAPEDHQNTTILKN
jgi:hypothetical protein